VDEATLTDASLLIGLSQFDEAERVLERVLTDADTLGDDSLAGRALEGLGTIATRRGQEGRALELFERALERSGWPDPAERESLYTNTARLRSFGGNARGAAELLEQCIERLSQAAEPDRAAMAHYAITLNFAYADAGEYGKANTLLAEVLRDGGEDLDLRVRQRLYYALTRLNMNVGRTDQAVEYADKMLELTISAGLVDIQFEAYLQSAHTRLDAGDTELAGEYLEGARRHAPEPLGSVDEGLLLVEEARYALQIGAHDLALEHARAAIELLGDQSVPGALGMAYLVVARVYDDTAEDDRADRAYLMAIDALRRQTGWPTDLAKAYRRYGKFLRRRGRMDAALEMLELASDTGF
jgi:tetratricopeptide (TPR) repeat protein